MSPWGRPGGANIVTGEGFDSPLFRYDLYRCAEDWGVGQRAYQRNADPKLNAQGHDFAKGMALVAKSTVAFNLSRSEAETPDPFFPGMSFDKGRWPNLKTVELLATWEAFTCPGTTEAREGRRSRTCRGRTTPERFSRQASTGEGRFGERLPKTVSPSS
jgi:hypothetical protein